jgi:hypothetical protein
MPKSMKAEELAGFQRSCWRNIAITLTTRFRISPLNDQVYGFRGCSHSGGNYQRNNIVAGIPRRVYSVTPLRAKMEIGATEPHEISKKTF